MLKGTACFNRVFTKLLKYMYGIKDINVCMVNTLIEHSINEAMYHGNMKSIILGSSTKAFWTNF